jgi:hypothetical protein
MHVYPDQHAPISTDTIIDTLEVAALALQDHAELQKEPFGGAFIDLTAYGVEGKLHFEADNVGSTLTSRTTLAKGSAASILLMAETPSPLACHNFTRRSRQLPGFLTMIL